MYWYLLTSMLLPIAKLLISRVENFSYIINMLEHFSEMLTFALIALIKYKGKIAAI